MCKTSNAIKHLVKLLFRTIKRCTKHATNNTFICIKEKNIHCQLRKKEKQHIFNYCKIIDNKTKSYNKK